MLTMSQAKVAAWLVEISDSLPDKMVMDDDGLAIVSGDNGYEFIIQALSPAGEDDEMAVVVFRTVMGPLPVQGAPIALYRLMTLNVFLQEKAGGTFGVDPISGQIVYTAAALISNLNPHSFLAMLERFIETGISLAEQISTLLESVKEQIESGVSATDNSSNEGGAPKSVPLENMIRI